jgi:hypothetical protein
MNKIISKLTFSKLIVLLILTGLLIINNNLSYWKKENRVIIWDVVSYYGYLPAAFIFDDLTMKFTEDYKGDKKFTIWAKKTDTGNYVLKTSMGPAILYSPFFFPAHSYAQKYGYNTGGYSEPYKFALTLSSVFYVFIGFIFLRKLLLKFYSELTTGIVLIALFLGTNLLWYSSYEAAMPHTQSFMLLTLFIYYSIKWHEKRKLKYAFILGISIGLISLIRPTNILIALFFIFYNFTKLSDTKKQINLFLKNYKHIILIILLTFIIWIPQFLYWKKVTGHYLYFSYTDEGFFFNNPQILNGLFSFRKGMLIYAPVLIFSLIGIPVLLKKAKPSFIGISIFTILNIYIIFSWWAWWYGGSLGQRAIIDSYAILALPLAAIFEYLIKQRKLVIIPFLVIFSLTILMGVYHTYLYKTGAIHWDGMTKEAYFDSFGRLKPSGKFYTLIKQPDYEAALKGTEIY